MSADDASKPPEQEAHERRQRMTGILLMMGAVASFACLDSTAKYLTAHMDTVQIVWARYTSAFLLAFIFINPFSHPGLMRTTRRGLQMGRSLLLLLSTIFNFIAVRYLQLDQTTAIMFMTPFLVALLAGPMLGEWTGARRWIAILVGFSGVLVVTRPGFGGIHPAALLCVAGSICYALYSITTRLLSRTDSSETTLFYSNLVGFAVMSAVLPPFWTTPTSALIVFLMIAIGAFGSFGHFLLIVAHRMAPAPILAPFVYTQLVWMIALGYAVFADVPSVWTLSGAAVVIASGLYLLYSEHRAIRRR
jgi:drug/metabolite transporter (DMT)-like permease